MSAEVLRRAATLMRERAEAAKWTLADPAWYVADDFTCTQPSEAEHIASWHPDVALAVADWLEYVADQGDRAAINHRARATKVARAYIGESS